MGMGGHGNHLWLNNPWSWFPTDAKKWGYTRGWRVVNKQSSGWLNPLWAFIIRVGAERLLQVNGRVIRLGVRRAILV